MFLPIKINSMMPLLKNKEPEIIDISGYKEEVIHISVEIIKIVTSL